MSDFNEFSDLAYLTLSLKACDYIKDCSNHFDVEPSDNLLHYYKWQQIHSADIGENLSSQIGKLFVLVDLTACDLNSIDECVDKLTDAFNEITRKCKHNMPKKRVIAVLKTQIKSGLMISVKTITKITNLIYSSLINAKVSRIETDFQIVRKSISHTVKE